MIAILKKLIAARRTNAFPATEVILATGGHELRLSFAHSDGGARVTLDGALTRGTAEMMAPWFVSLRTKVLAVELDVEGLMRLDKDALPAILAIARGCVCADVRFRVQTSSGRWRERLSDLEPSGMLRRGQSTRRGTGDRTSSAPRHSAAVI